MPPILDRLEPILARIVEQPLAKTIAQLQELADAEPNNPGPPLALAVVNSFTRHDFKTAKAHLQRAERALRRPDTPEAETAFARALFAAISAEFQLLQLPRPARGVNLDQLTRRVEAEKASQTAVDQLGASLRRLRGSTLAQTIHQALRVLSRANAAGSPAYRSGMTSLSRLRRTSKSPDLASLFLVYGHRRAQAYRPALQAAQELERARPNSALAKEIVGSCFHFMGDLDAAERQYRQAVALAPEEPSAQLGLATVLERRGQVAEARQVARRAAEADREGVVAPFIKALNQDLDIRERLGR